MLEDLLDYNERINVILNFEIAQKRQSLQVESAMQSFLGMGQNDLTYTVYRSNTKFMLEVAGPHTVRFSQNSIRNTFKNGLTLEELAASLRQKQIKITAIEPIRLINRDGIFYTLDNRRLEAFRRARLRVPYRMATEKEIADEIWKLTSKDGGFDIKIRGNKL